MEESWIDNGWSVLGDTWIDNGWSVLGDTWIDHGWSVLGDTWIDHGWNNDSDWNNNHSWEDNSSWDDDSWDNDTTWDNNSSWDNYWYNTTYSSSTESNSFNELKNPLKSFWYVAALIALLSLPFVGFIFMELSDSLISSGVGNVVSFLVSLSLPLLGFGLPVFIVKTIHYKRFRELDPYESYKNPLANGMFVLSWILVVGSIILGLCGTLIIVFSNEETNLVKWIALAFGFVYWFLFGLIIMIIKFKRYKNWK